MKHLIPMNFHLIPSFYIVASPLMLLKKIFPYGYAEHNVCSSATPVFNFRTWKAFPSKETEKQSFPLWHEEYDLHPVCQSVFPSPHNHFVHPPTPNPPPCRSVVVWGSYGPLFYMAFDGFVWPAREQLTNFAVYCSRLWLSSHTVSQFVKLLLEVCLRGSPGTGQFTVNSTKGTVPGQSDILLSLQTLKNAELLQASGLRSYRCAFSIVVVTWYFMGLHLCLQKQQGHIL